MTSPSLSHCAALVRDQDRDRYLCALFAPADAREAWFALFAFNLELAAIPVRVKEEMIGFMRFAWWREALDEIYEAKPVRRHPVAEALAEAVRRHHLPRAPLDALLHAREERLGEAKNPPTEGFFRATSGGLLALCAMAAGEPANAALEALGLAWGYIGAARAAGESGVLPLARRAWAQAKPLPLVFRPFRDAAGFHLRRLERGVNTQPESAFMLAMLLCWRYFCRRLYQRYDK